MTEKEFLDLLSRFKSGSLNEQERHMLACEVAGGRFDELVKEDVMKTLWKPAGKRGVLYYLGSGRVRVAASILVLVVAGLSALFVLRKKKGTFPAPTAATADIRPGTSRATLTLADGSVMELDSSGNARNLSQGNTHVQVKSGLLSYSGENNGAAVFNTLNTPKGGQYKIVLSDGTKVWVNAASSLKYPAAFNGTDRTVELKGEAYFEVEKDAERPFRVKVDGKQVDVLGTSFNVMAYDDEEIMHTTLLEGAVKVSGGNASRTLAPGQQAKQGNDGNISVKEVDVEEAVAWKNGLFLFQDADVRTVMRQISRWYDIEIAYDGVPKTIKLNGEVYRNYNLSQVLTVLSAAGLQFKIEGKKLIVIS